MFSVWIQEQGKETHIIQDETLERKKKNATELHSRVVFVQIL